MTALLGMPLVASGVVAAACALAGLAHPVAALALGAVVVTLALALALASGDRPRRVLWSAVAASAALVALRAFVVLPPLGVLTDPRVLALREALAAPIRALVPEPEAGIVLGIVLGERSSIPRDLKDAFAVTGTAHLLAISGSNMTLVGSAVAFALRHRARPLAVAAGTLAAVAAYSVLVGLGASVVRAALMAAVTSLGLALGRRAAAANGLGAAVVAMLVADPANVVDVGFQLSVAATAGLIAWQRPLSERFSRLPRLGREALAATVAASVPTIPIVAAVFGRVSLISPLANLVAVPLFAPIMLFGAATAALGAPVPSAAWPLAMAAYASASALRHVVEIGSAVPLAAVTVPPSPVTALVLAALLVVGWLALGRVAAALGRVALRTPALPPLPRTPRGVFPIAGAVAVCLGVVVAGAAAAGPLARPSGFRLHALDVGQGDAFLIESDGRYALIDGGPDPTLVLKRLGAVLPPWQRRIDLVALTHEHADHGAGLLGVLDRYQVGLAIEPAGMNDVPLVRMWAERLARSGVPRRAVAQGAVIRLGRATIRVLAPGPDRKVEVPSLVLHVSSPASSVLFMGDATDDAIADVLLDGGALPARVYVPPHHGAETVHASTLVAAVHPEAAVISVGALNKYGHPTPTTLAALQGMPVYRTDRYGTVDIDLDGRPLGVRTAASALPLDRGGPLPSAPAAR